MPQPPQADIRDLQELVRYLLQQVREEHAVAATRHEEVLTRLLEQKDDFKDFKEGFREKTGGLVENFGAFSSQGTSDQPLITKELTEKLEQLHLQGDSIKEQLSQLQSDGLSKPAHHTTAAGLKGMKGKLAAKSFHNLGSDTMPETPESTLSGNLCRKSKLAFGQKEVLEDLSPRNLRGMITSIISHPRFEVFIACIITFNALVMAFEVQYMGFQVGYDLSYRRYIEANSSTWPFAQAAFDVLDWFFGVLFCVEALMKFVSLAHRYFCDVWNWIDLICVLAWLLDKGLSALIPINAGVLRLLRLFRLIRLVRLLRTLEALDVLYIMTTAIRGMTMVLTWAVSLLSVMLMTCALMLTQILHSTVFAEDATANLSGVDLERHQKLYAYFGTFTRSFFSMYEITLANWPPVARLLSEEISEWFFLICVIHKLTIGFAVVGVINGVILQETFKVASTDDMIMVRQKKRASQNMREKMENLLEALDHSGDGLLDLEEFKIISNHPEVKLWLASMDIETDDLHTLFRLLDSDDSGSVSVEELCTRIPRLRGPARSIDLLAMTKRLQDVTMTVPHV